MLPNKAFCMHCKAATPSDTLSGAMVKCLHKYGSPFWAKSRSRTKSAKETPNPISI